MTEEQQARPKIRLLLLCGQLVVQHSEVGFITKNLSAVCAHSVEIVEERVTKAGAALESIAKYQPDIVHFYGECTTDGRFIFAGEDGKTTDWCSKRFLLKKIGTLPTEIKLVYFNGAVSEQEVEAAEGKIAAFFCMQRKGDAKLSKRIVVPFYTALAFGNPLGFAFKKLWEALPEEERHIMLRFRKDINPDNFFLREQAGSAQVGEKLC